MVYTILNSLFLVISILRFALASEKLVLTDLTGVYTSSSISWNANNVYLCGATDFTEFANTTALGWFGYGNNSTSKNFTNLPPHWSITIRFELILYESLDPNDYIYVNINGQTDAYQKDAYWLGYYFCYLNNYYYDEIVLFHKNFTSHTDSFINILVWSKTDESILNEGFGLKNLYLSVDTCHESCLTCNGPTANQCTSCPPNSTQNGNTCKCNSGTYAQDNKCVNVCPAGQIKDSTGTLCIQDFCYSVQCQTCSNSICTLCQSGYYLLNGQCVQSCPSYTTVNGQQCIDIITKTSYGQYLYKGMFSTYFGEGEISGTGLSYSGFQGYLTNPSRAMTTVCGGKSLLGGAYLSSVNSYISKNFTGIAPHWTVLIGYTLYKIDNWNNESIQMIVDNDVKNTTTKSASDGTSNICGRVSFKDQIIYVTQNFTHTATSLNLKISSTLASTPFTESYGIREMFILVDYCTTNCAVCNAQGCTKCQTNFYLYNFQCVSQCPSNYAPDTNQSCQPCDATCLTCSFPQSSTSCKTCKPNTYLNPNNSCQSTCPDKYWPNTSNLTCQTCDTNCYNCKSPGDQNSCTSCSGNVYLSNNQCISTCPPGTFPLKQTNNNICQPCDSSCKTCNGQNSNNCQSCQAPNLFYQASSSTCVSSCNTDQYKNTINQTCSQCNSICATCSGPNNNNCSSCTGNSFLYQNQCIPNCPNGYFNNTNNNTCTPCDSSCYTCNGNAPNNCLSCQLQRYFNPVSNQCVYTCNSNQYPDPTSIQCKSCDSKCLTCNGPSATQCTSCGNGLYLENNQCVQQCSQSYYVKPNTNICQQCDSSCLTCSGPSSQECTSCATNLIFLNSQCYSECPSEYYTSQESQTKECKLCNYQCKLGCSGPLAEDCDSIKYQYQIISYILAGKFFLWCTSSILGFIMDKKQSRVQVETFARKVSVESDKLDNLQDSPQIEEYYDRQQQNGEKSSTKFKSETASQQNQQDLINLKQQALQFQMKVDLDKMKRVGNRRPRQKFYKNAFYDRSMQTFEFQLPSIAFNMNSSSHTRNPNELGGTVTTVPNLSQVKTQMSGIQEVKITRPYIYKYKMNEIFKFTILGNEWVSLFYFYDHNLNRLTRATLIFLKYLAFFFSTELIYSQSYYLLITCLLFGWTSKQWLKYIHQLLTKISSKFIQLILLTFLALISVHMYFWFVPQLMSLKFLKDETWSLYYGIVSATDFVVFQQLFSFFEYIYSIKYLNNQFNRLKLSKIYQLVINQQFIKKIKQNEI
ncbi:zinc finger lsd1 subclass family protein (macronuclear) [Tetrahymena thermophila SB210]|uniref:Zinc finger lsd1 subclass family protein n=1 Tax=Tetrahymena thermophila (strain SB210) TaxID=312017 RepID=Q22Z26_TETTS|nr:zinc finger lsd1 subclass family protein [Tetrahymena thermophila SB210]EAR90495.3 zinc finger lsd1 subclass family protein [Tetrahymena thermophila SB210]|eukprot:XP_001010740.3 zinc finger lsd1 subclass family protein [Tetrahymena thermophila SB210]